MNNLAIDFGTKRIGLAYSVNDLIFTLPAAKNDEHIFDNLQKIIKDYQIEKIYVGLCEGKIAKLTQNFVSKLSTMVKLDIETVEESVSTLEANKIFVNSKNKNKNYQQQIDSIAAAVILNRVIGS